MGDWRFPRWIAHRGAGKLAPENTLAAFRVGASHGYRAFECDLKLSADGVPFLLHDATLDRTTDMSGNAGDKTWAELSRADAGSWHGRLHAGEPMPTLLAIAAYVLRNGFALDIEIKPSPGTDVTTGERVATEAAQLWQGSTLPLLLSSFSVEALRAARDAAPGLPRALLLDHLWPGAFDTAAQLGCVAVITEHTLMDAATVATIRGAGQRALVYTVNDEARANELLALGIDGIVTDAIDRFPPAS